MDGETLANDPTWKTWALCKSVLQPYNYSLKFPKNTDPRNTYQWRYANRLSTRFDEWGFDGPTAQVFLEVAAKRIGAAALKKSGLGSFFCNGLLEAVYKELEVQESGQHKNLEGLQESRTFLLSKFKSGQRLLDRPVGDFNLVSWYMASRISASYLALSKSCNSALGVVWEHDPIQGEKLPSKAALLAKRRSLVTNNDFTQHAKQILGDDWKTC